MVDKYLLETPLSILWSIYLEVIADHMIILCLTF